MKYVQDYIIFTIT